MDMPMEKMKGEMGEEKKDSKVLEMAKMMQTMLTSFIGELEGDKKEDTMEGSNDFGEMKETARMRLRQGRTY